MIQRLNPVLVLIYIALLFPSCNSEPEEDGDISVCMATVKNRYSQRFDALEQSEVDTDEMARKICDCAIGEAKKARGKGTVDARSTEVQNMLIDACAEQEMKDFVFYEF